MKINKHCPSKLLHWADNLYWRSRNIYIYYKLFLYKPQISFSEESYGCLNNIRITAIIIKIHKNIIPDNMENKSNTNKLKSRCLLEQKIYSLPSERIKVWIQVYKFNLLSFLIKASQQKRTLPLLILFLK